MKRVAHSGLEELIRRRVRKEIINRSAYKILPSRGQIKLDAMESPYVWPELIQVEWLSMLQDVELNRYPDANAVELCEDIRTWSGLDNSADVILGNGSDELIQMIIMALGGPVLAPEPTFGMYKFIAEALGCQFIGVPLLDSFLLDQKQMLSAIEKHDPSCIFLAYPNNPTGNLFDYKIIENIIESASGLVVIDEAYHPYSNRTFLNEIQVNDHLSVLRTLSKFGLAGLRLGFLAGPNPWIQEINKVRLPYNINSLTQVSARFAFSKEAWFRQHAEQTCRERYRLGVKLQKLLGVKVYQSETNFLLIRLLEKNVDVVFDFLIQHKILIKNMNGTHEDLKGCLRVTIGTADENDAFFEALSIALRN